MTTETTKIAIVGAGSTLACSLARSGVAREIVLIDTDRERAEGEAMDIAHAATFHAPATVAAGSLEAAAGAAITVITAGCAQGEGESRRCYSAM